MIKFGERSTGRIVYPKSKYMWAQQKYNEPDEPTCHRSQHAARVKAKELLRKESGGKLFVMNGDGSVRIKETVVAVE